MMFSVTSMRKQGQLQNIYLSAHTRSPGNPVQVENCPQSSSCDVAYRAQVRHCTLVFQKGGLICIWWWDMLCHLGPVRNPWLCVLSQGDDSQTLTSKDSFAQASSSTFFLSLCLYISPVMVAEYPVSLRTSLQYIKSKRF